MTDTGSAAERVLEALRRRDRTLATAESLTGGLVCAALTAVPGASAVVLGGVTAYASRVKQDVLGVDGGLLARRGAVDRDVALAMAEGVARLLGATHAVATTGVAGPDPQDGRPVGAVVVAVRGPGTELVRELHLPGGRAEVRAGTVAAALALLGELLNGEDGESPA